MESRTTAPTALVDSAFARLTIGQQSGEQMQRERSWGPAKIDVPVQMGLNKVIIRGVGPSTLVKGDPRDNDGRVSGSSGIVCTS